MSWEQFAVFVLAMVAVNVGSHLMIRGLFGGNAKGSGKEDGKEDDGSMYATQQVVSNRISDIWREINYLRCEMEKRVSESICEARMEKLEDVIEEVKRRLESIEGKIDRMLGKREV
jgi:tetrahydromethanopterin S-methyltransferase subunit G